MRSKRKLEHIEHAVNTQPAAGMHSMNDIQLVHNSLSEASVSNVDLSVKVGELKFSSPVFMNAMTGGGGEETTTINASLAKAASKYNMAMAVGSQTAAIKDPKERKSFEIVRTFHDKGVIFANVGSSVSVTDAKEAVKMVQANALQIHLNQIQELTMPEGDRSFSGICSRISRIVEMVDVPVIIKEVGYGISMESAARLKSLGVAFIDVGGKGGTDFSKIENLRRKDPYSFFENWGLPVSVSLVESLQIFKSGVLASGGFKEPLPIIKALIMGAEAVGMAGPLLYQLLHNGEAGLDEYLHRLHENLTFIMTGLGCENTHQLKKLPFVVTGQTFHWLEQRGISVSHFARRERK